MEEERFKEIKRLVKGLGAQLGIDDNMAFRVIIHYRNKDGDLDSYATNVTGSIREAQYAAWYWENKSESEVLMTEIVTAPIGKWDRYTYGNDSKDDIAKMLWKEKFEREGRYPFEYSKEEPR